MTQIKIEVPANDTIALNAFAEALQRIADERSDERVFTGLVEQAEKNSVEHVEGFEYEVDDEPLEETFKQAKQTLSTINALVDDGLLIRPEQDGDATPPSEVNDTLDKDGIPWDGRIHSKGKSRLTDDTWRLRKRPADKDEDEWSAYVESVKSELLAVQNAPVTQLGGVTPNGDTVTVPNVEAGEPCPPVTPPVEIDDISSDEIEQIVDNVRDKFQTSPPSAVVPPVAAVTPPTSLTPPPASEASESDVTTFPQLMKYITSDAAKRGATNDLVKQALVKTDPSLISIQLIGGRIDLIPQFIKNLEELIGE